jgi:hypothetical protein
VNPEEQAARHFSSISLVNATFPFFDFSGNLSGGFSTATIYHKRLSKIIFDTTNPLGLGYIYQGKPLGEPR